MRVAIYARHSSDKQTTSTTDQIARCQAWCLQKGYEVSEIFYDEAISGANLLNRPGIRDLISVSLQTSFDRIICEDLSRLSRDQSDIASFFKKMLFLDIPIETIAEGEINELHIGLKGTMNALYLKDLADKTRRGMIAAVLGGSLPGGRTFGYDLIREYHNGVPIKGLRAVNAAEADIVRKIYQDYYNGQTLEQICASLNRLAIPAPRGDKWLKTTLIGTQQRKTGILRQTLYKGIVTFNKMAYKKHPDSGKRLSVMRPEDEWIRVPLPELAILDDALFNDVQALIDHRSSRQKLRRQHSAVMTREEKRTEAAETSRNNRKSQIKERRYPLQLISRKLYCADHGTSIRSIRSGLYNCPVRECSNRNLHRAPLIDLTRQSMKKISVSDLKLFLTSKKEERKNLLKEQSIQQCLLDKKRTEIKTLLDHFSSKKAGQETMRFLDEKEVECQRLVYKIASLQKQITSFTIPPNKNLQDIVSKFHNLIEKNRHESEDNATLEQLVSFIKKVELSSQCDHETLVVIFEMQDLIESLR